MLVMTLLQLQVEKVLSRKLSKRSRRKLDKRKRNRALLLVSSDLPQERARHLANVLSAPPMGHLAVDRRSEDALNKFTHSISTQKRFRQNTLSHL